MDKKRSSEESVSFRVPQGSLLGPLLFVVMINDLLYLLNSHSKLHIDDTNFLNTSTYFRLLKITTKNTLYQAVVWFRSNGFKLNVKKTQHMVISLRDMPVDINVSGVKCLGIFVDMWSWESHVD